MGRIYQLNPDYTVPIHEQKSINTTQWRYIIVYEEPHPDHKPVGIEVCTKTEVHFIYDITLDTFNRINQHNESAEFKYEYKCTHIACRNCNGSGIIDWIDKATTGGKRHSVVDVLRGRKYTRNKEGLVNVYKADYWEQTRFMYSSTPKLKVGEEFCPQCLGCGIQMSAGNKFAETTFNQC